jgi:hypothetical protein
MSLVSRNSHATLQMTWIPMRRSKSVFLNGLDGGLAYALEAWDLENF